MAGIIQNIISFFSGDEADISAVKTSLELELIRCETKPEQVVGDIRSSLKYVLSRKDLGKDMRALVTASLADIEKDTTKYITNKKAAITVKEKVFPWVHP